MGIEIRNYSNILLAFVLICCSSQRGNYDDGHRHKHEFGYCGVAARKAMKDNPNGVTMM